MNNVQDTGSTGTGSLLAQVGLLRVSWAAIIVFCLVMVFFADGDGAGWSVIPVYIGPALVILNVWVLLFDMLMATIFLKQAHGRERLRYRNVLLWDGSLLVALFAFWGPWFVSLVNR